MSQSIYSALRGIVSQQQRIDTIANNLANVNTIGFKSTRVDFKDAVYRAINIPGPQGGAGTLMSGSGVMSGAMHRTFRSGSMVTTDNVLDFALGGDGFFAVLDAQGEIRYTKSGAFGISVETEQDEADASALAQEKKFLVTAEGYYVLDENGNKIEILGNTSGLSVSAQGEITFEVPVVTKENAQNITGGIDAIADEAPAAIKLGIFAFVNPQGLEATGNNLYTRTDMSGVPAFAKETQVMQGTLEQSNVEMSEEFSRLIRAQRALSLASRALTTADEMDGMINQLR